MSEIEQWFIVKQDNGQCAIVSTTHSAQTDLTSAKHWGPFGSQSEAIARRVGLIRAGKCKPA